MTTLLMALMVVAAAPAPGAPVRVSDPLPAHAIKDFVAPQTHAWSDDGWALRLRYVVATNLDVLATARGNVDLVKAEWVAGVLYARTDLRLRSWGVLAAVDRGLTPDVLASSVVLGSQFAFHTALQFVPAVGVKLQASPKLLTIRSVDDAAKIPMEALVYLQFSTTK